MGRKMDRRSSGGFGSFGGGFRSSGGRSRSSGGGFGSSRSASSNPKPAAAKAASPRAQRDNKGKKAPAPAAATIEPQGLMSSLVDGFGWGAGNSIGHRIGEAVFGPRTVRVEAVEPSTPAPAPTMNSLGSSDSCDGPYNAFMDCVYGNKTDISKCQAFMDKFSVCRGDSSHLDNLDSHLSI